MVKEKEVKEQLKEILQSKALSSLTFDGSLYSEGEGYKVDYKEAMEGVEGWTINELGLALLEKVEFDLSEDVRISFFTAGDTVLLDEELDTYGSLDCMHFEVRKFNKNWHLDISLCECLYASRKYNYYIEATLWSEGEEKELLFETFDTFEEALQSLKSYILNNLNV